MTSPSRRASVVLAGASVFGHLAALYWPVVTVEGPVSWTDKVVHVVLFAVPTYAVGRALQLAGRSARPAVLLLVAHAPLSEIGQHLLLPGRSGDPWDVVVDLVGVALGGAALTVRRRRVVSRAAPLAVVGPRVKRW